MTNEELQKEMIAAMKAKDKVRLSIIRQVKAEVKNIEVNERRDVTEEDVNSMIKRLIKQTSETLEMSIKAGTDQERTDNLTEQVNLYARVYRNHIVILCDFNGIVYIVNRVQFN